MADRNAQQSAPGDSGVEVITPQIVHVGRGARRTAEMLAGAFLAGYQNPNTRSSYAADLRYWFAFLEDDAGVDPIHGVHRSHLELYMRMAEAKKLKPATVNRRAGTICTFYGFLVDEGILNTSPVRTARRPKVPKDSTRLSLGRHELALWLDEAENEGGYPYALACLLAMNGLRISEATAADVEDLTTERWHNVLRIMGKGQKPDLVPLPPRTMQAITDALDGRTTGPLLLNRYGNRMNRESAGRIVARFARRIGVDKRITPHSLRHSAITAVLDAGAPLRDAQQFARHEDPRTTMRYDRARVSLDRHPAYLVMQHIAGSG